VSGLFEGNHPLPKDAAYVGLIGLGIVLVFYTWHSIWVSAEMYSAPSIVMQTRSANGVHIFDDFREGYAWLRYNTPEDAIVASWYEHGLHAGDFMERLC
jgi:dolichyl-diphosphooligosaccharide--protein glycosyltransferase